MDPPQSSSSSIIMNHVRSDIGEVAEPIINPHNMPQDQAPSPTLLAAERDNVFYFETVTFQVEDTLFRVFKSGFEVQGTPFEAIFSLPQAPGEIVEGTCDSKPIYLHGISKVNFRSFLRVLYPFKGAVTTYPEWIAVLDLATMWDFKEIRKTCIEALSELIKPRAILDNILLAKKYKVKKWLRDGYVQLLQQRKALEFGDDICSSEMDLLTITKLLYIREKTHCQLSSLQRAMRYYDHGRVADHYLFSTEEANSKINEAFADEFAGMQDD